MEIDWGAVIAFGFAFLIGTCIGGLGLGCFFGSFSIVSYIIFDSFF